MTSFSITSRRQRIPVLAGQLEPPHVRKNGIWRNEDTSHRKPSAQGCLVEPRTAADHNHVLNIEAIAHGICDCCYGFIDAHVRPLLVTGEIDYPPADTQLPSGHCPIYRIEIREVDPEIFSDAAGDCLKYCVYPARKATRALGHHLVPVHARPINREVPGVHDHAYLILSATHRASTHGVIQTTDRLGEGPHMADIDPATIGKRMCTFEAFSQCSATFMHQRHRQTDDQKVDLVYIHLKQGAAQQCEVLGAIRILVV